MLAHCFAKSDLNMLIVKPPIPFSARVKSSPLSETGINYGMTVPRSVTLERFALKVRHMRTRSSLKSENEEFKQRPSRIDEKDGLIIVDHGSRRSESNLMLSEFVAMFRDKTGYPIVEPAHMELAEPSIRDAFNSCVQQGVRRIIVSPFFLFPGRHWDKDIPSLTAEAAREHPGISYVITAPLGLHELLVDVVNDRITHCLSHVAGVADECEVCTGTGKCRTYQFIGNHK